MNYKETKEVKLTCFGCGCELQNTNPSLTGYTPKPIGKDGTVLCQRCYRLQHYGETKEEAVVMPNYKEIFSKSMKKHNLIIYVVDLFAFESSIVRDVHPFIKDNPILVVANKRDVLPKSVDDNKLKQFVFDRLAEEGIYPKEVAIGSAYKNYNIEEILQFVLDNRDGKDVYIIGASSVGKSSLINALLKIYKNETKTMISTSPYPGTTVDTISVPLDNKTKLFDTPGVIVPSSIFASVETNAMKYIIPRTEIKPKTFQLNSKQSLIVGGIARFDFEKTGKTNCTLYVSNEVDVHRCKLSKANSVFESLVSKENIHPISASINSIEKLERHEVVLPETKVDIYISGYCWLSLEGKNQTIVIWAPSGVDVVVRQCKI